MLPTKEEQDVKYRTIQTELGGVFSKEKEVAQEYAKWYAEQVVKHCAEATKTEVISEYEVVVDKQSILNVINEL